MDFMIKALGNPVIETCLTVFVFMALFCNLQKFSREIPMYCFVLNLN